MSQMFVVLLFWLFQSELCVLCLLLAVLQAAPDLHILDLTIKGNSVSANTKWQALPPTSLREVRALQDVIPGVLVKERKKKTPVSLLALPLPYSHFICVCKVVHFIALNQGARKTPNWVLQDILIFHLSLPYLSNIPAYPFTFKNGAIRSNLFFNWNLIRETGNPNFRSSGRPGQAGEDGKQEREIGSQNKTTLQWNHPKGKNEKTSTIYILLQSTLIMCFKFFYITTPR